MSYTLDNLRKAKEALENGNENECLDILDDLIERYEALLQAQKHYKPSGLTRMEEPVDRDRIQKILNDSKMWIEKEKDNENDQSQKKNDEQ